VFVLPLGIQFIGGFVGFAMKDDGLENVKDEDTLSWRHGMVEGFVGMFGCLDESWGIVNAYKRAN
jgi:hypothetical protein